jgi:hypothetical protein
MNRRAEMIEKRKCCGTLEGSEHRAGCGAGSESELHDLLCVGDTVKITKRGNIGGEHSACWLLDMDRYNGRTATITGAHEGEDGEPHEYDIDIDHDDFTWLHHWLDKVGA